MEEKIPTSDEEKLPSRIPNFLQKHVDTRQKMLFILAGATILLLGGLGYMMVSPKKAPQPFLTKQTVSPTPVPTVPIATSSVIPTSTHVPTAIPSKASKSAAFVSYNILSGEEKFAVAYNFIDSLLKMSFAYPPGYQVASYKADKNDKIAGVFFTKDGSTVQRNQDMVQCVLDNRKNPSGICRESRIRDVEVTILPFEQHDNIFPYDGNPFCQRDINTSSRVLFSCEEQMSVDATDKGMSYILYFLQDNPIQLQVSARDPKTHAHLIRSIISSSANHLQ